VVGYFNSLSLITKGLAFLSGWNPDH